MCKHRHMPQTFDVKRIIKILKKLLTMEQNKFEKAYQISIKYITDKRITHYSIIMQELYKLNMHQRSEN